jgi:hypothetical protein
LVFILQLSSDKVISDDPKTNIGSIAIVIFGNNISSSSTAWTSAFAISGNLNVNKFAMTAVQ